MEGTNTDQILESNGFWAKVPGWILILITFLLPILFLPTSIVSMSFLKSVTFLSLIYLALFIWIILRFKDERFSISFNLLSLSALLVPVIYLISAFFSQNFTVSMFGRDFGFDSVMVLSSFFVILLLGASTLKNKKMSLYAYAAIILSGLVVAVFHILNIFFGGFLPNLGYFFTNTSNTIGKWFDLGVYSGMMLIFSLIAIEYIKVIKWLKWVMKILFAFSLLVLILVGFQDLWIIAGIFSLMSFTYFLVVNRAGNEGLGVSIPVLSLITLIISILFIIAGPKINFAIQDAMNLQFSEARPTMTTTARVIKDSVMSDPVLGAGPNQFSSVWVANKPVDSNISDYWNVNFRYGFGFIPTLMASTGVLGILSWILFLGTLIVTGIRMMFKPVKDNISRFILISSFISSLYLWIMLVLYVPSYTTLFLTFLFTSIFFGSLNREKLIRTKEVSITKSPKHGFTYIFGLIVILLLVVGSSYKLVSRIYAAILDRDVNIALSQEDWSEAERKAINAINVDVTDIRYAQLSSIYQYQISEVNNNSDLDNETKSAIYSQLLSGAISASQSAINFDDSNYQNYINQMKLFLEIANPDEPAIAEKIISLSEKVKELYPINPETPLILARLNIILGNNDVARQYIEEALQLKPNYTEAIFLLSQLEVSEGNIDQAISNVQTVASIRPNDPTVFFQLGLLYYQGDEYEKAVPAFERAVRLSPFYSNAKYFLGLSYSEIGRTEEAVLQFKDLVQLNPDNNEVKGVLNNLESGNSPVSEDEENPEDRENLPLEEDDIVEGDETGISE